MPRSKLSVCDERGTETVEWAIFTGLIVSVLIAALAAVGTWMRTRIQGLQTEMESS